VVLPHGPNTVAIPVYNIGFNIGPDGRYLPGDPIGYRIGRDGMPVPADIGFVVVPK
jgi:hypothetical protein